MPFPRQLNRDMFQGRIAESGTHAELLSNPNSRYAELWNSQHLKETPS